MEHNCVKEAIESFSEALDSSKGSPEIMLKVGMSLYDNNFPKHACKIFEKYLDVTDNNIALPYLAACYHDMGDREKYLEYLKEACRLVPQETEIVFDEQFPEGVSPENYYDYEIQNEKQ
jgi:tetratricopeptide (TPR) repeat protein